MSRPRLQRIIGLVAAGVIAFAVVGLPLLTIPFWLTATLLGGFALVAVAIDAGPFDSSRDDDSEA